MRRSAHCRLSRYRVPGAVKRALRAPSLRSGPSGDCTTRCYTKATNSALESYGALLLKRHKKSCLTMRRSMGVEPKTRKGGAFNAAQSGEGGPRPEKLRSAVINSNPVAPGSEWHSTAA